MKQVAGTRGSELMSYPGHRLGTRGKRSHGYHFLNLSLFLIYVDFAYFCQFFWWIYANFCKFQHTFYISSKWRWILNTLLHSPQLMKVKLKLYIIKSPAAFFHVPGWPHQFSNGLSCFCTWDKSSYEHVCLYPGPECGTRVLLRNLHQKVIRVPFSKFFQNLRVFLPIFWQISINL